MNKTVKTCTGLGGGGLIAGGGIVAEEYLNGKEEDKGHFAPAVISKEEVIEDTIEKALIDLKLEIPKDSSEYNAIFEELRSAGVDSWVTGITTHTEWNSRRVTNQRMMQKCQETMKKDSSEFKTESMTVQKKNEWKTIKVICTKNYSIMDNARDYVGDENTIYDSSKEINEDKWRSKLDEFKRVRGNDKTYKDLKDECLKKGKTVYRRNSRDKTDFYNYCVIR